MSINPEKRPDFQARMAEAQKKREQSWEQANIFCEECFSKIKQNSFNIGLFLDGLTKLDPEAFERVMNLFLAHENRFFWEALSIDELKPFLDMVFASKWFKSFEYGRDLFDVIARHKHGIEILSHFYKIGAKTESKLADYCARQLIESEKGRNNLVDILNSSDEQIKYTALIFLAEYCVDSMYENPRVNPDAKLYLGVLRKFLFHSHKDFRTIILNMLHKGQLLDLPEVIELLKNGDHSEKSIALKSLAYVEINTEKTVSLFPLLVESLEDENINISNIALEGIAHVSKKHSGLIADEIVNGLIIRTSNKPKEFFNSNLTVSALRETFKNNPRLSGQVLHKLCEVAYKSSNDVRNRAIFVAIAINKKEYIALVNENREQNPSIANAILNTVTGNLDSNQIASQISATDPKDIQQNAANQITLLAKYYENGLAQAKTSFAWAIAMTIISIIGFIVAVILFINSSDKTGTLIAAIGGALNQLLAGTLFFLYQKTLAQLSHYNQQMSKVQNYLLANSFIEALQGEKKEQARLDLIKSIAAISDIKDLPVSTSMK